VAESDNEAFADLLRQSIDRPSEARVYDFYLGGASNFGPTASSAAPRSSATRTCR